MNDAVGEQTARADRGAGGVPPHEVVVTVSGPLDAATARGVVAQALAALEAAGESGPRLVVDLSALTVLDSSGLGALVTLHSSAIAAGGVMQLRNVTDSALRLIDRVGLGGVFERE